MSIEPEGWHMDAFPSSWDAEAKTELDPIGGTTGN